MKPILFIAAMLVSLSATAQIDTTTYVYCQMRVIGNIDKNTKIALDFGEERSWASMKYRNEKGEVEKFNSMVDAVNFMASQHWYFVETFTLPNMMMGGVYLYVVFRRPRFS
jgi:hypothetical protein